MEDLKLKLSNLWFDICFCFWSKKRKKAWRAKPWSWKERIEPIVICGDNDRKRKE